MLTKFVDMRRTDEEKKEQANAVPSFSSEADYPYGLSISLTHNELEKLGIEADCEVGDLIHLFALAKVTSVSINDSGSGKQCRVELQITHLATESEDEENEEADEQPLEKYGYTKLS